MIYGTYGEGCEHFRFRRVRPGVYQRVVRLFGFLWFVDKGRQLRDHDAMFFPMESP
jgi:hypothetical protein